MGSNSSFQINYQYEEGIGLGLITIEKQVEFFSLSLEEFFNGYVRRRTGQAIEQFKDYGAYRQVVHILIELDQKYNLPWDEMNLEKLRIQENLKVNHGYDVELVLACFPLPNLK